MSFLKKASKENYFFVPIMIVMSPRTHANKKNTPYLLRRPTKLIEMCPVCNVVCTAANREMFCPNRTNPIDHFQSFCNARVTLKPNANQIIVELRFYFYFLDNGWTHRVIVFIVVLLDLKQGKPVRG